MAKGILALFMLVGLVGCFSGPVNPSFPVTYDLATADLKRMRQDQKPTQRPVVVSAGYFDMGFASGDLARRLQDLTHKDSQIIAVNYIRTKTLEEAAEFLIKSVQNAFPSEDPDVTVPVDVIGISMGGLVARRATDERGLSGRRLNAINIYTIVTPHRGANLAGQNATDIRVQQMSAGSDFLEELSPPDQANYENLYPYARLDDFIVGTSNTAPWGMEPWWVTNMPFESAHVFAYRDRRIVVDIVRRLRREVPWSIEPAMPPPGQSTETHVDNKSSKGS